VANDRPKLRVLFLCTGNSCRSQMAEGWARALKSDTIDAYSAGTQPHGLDRLAIRSMHEAGVDISAHASKHIDSLRGIAFDYVVSVCDAAREACPVFPGMGTCVHRRFDDPPQLAHAAGSDDEALPHYRRVRDEIRRFIESLHAALSVLQANSEIQHGD
jgi:arsenate reductase